MHFESSIQVVKLSPVFGVENGFWNTVLRLTAGIKLAAGLTLLPDLLIHLWLDGHMKRQKGLQHVSNTSSAALNNVQTGRTGTTVTNSSRWTTWRLSIWTQKALEHGKISLSLSLGLFPPRIQNRVVSSMSARQKFFATASEFLLKVL